MICFRCQKKLDAIDIGAYRKLIDKQAEDYLCQDCLAQDLHWTRDYLDAVVRLHRERGCSFFPPLDGEDLHD